MCCYICCCCLFCFRPLQAKTLEIILIIFHSIDAAFLLCCLIAIDWKTLSLTNLIFFILMLFIATTLLVFIILLRYWRGAGAIKGAKKKAGIILSKIGFILIILFLVVCIVEEFIYVFTGFNNNCYEKDENDYYTYTYYYKKSLKGIKNNLRILKVKDICYVYYYLLYFTFSFLEITLFLGIYIWYIINKVIEFRTDMLPLENTLEGGGGIVTIRYTSEPCKKKRRIFKKPKNFLIIENNNCLSYKI